MARKRTDKEVLKKLKRQIKREQPAERRDMIRVDDELDEAIKLYIDELKREEPNIKIDRGIFWRTAAREYLGIVPKAGAGPKAKIEPQYINMNELMPA